jgi:hypothetical protein
MKEQDLIDLGFKRTDVSAEESGDKAFYYYDIDFGDQRGISLISPANNEVIDNKWFVEVFEDNSIRIDNTKDLKQLIEIIKRNTHARKTK